MKYFVLLFLSLCSLMPSRLHAQVGYTSFGYSPVGETIWSKPRLAWRVLVSGTVTEVRMTLNGSALPATFDTGRNLVIATPTTPLAPGSYTVQCQLQLKVGKPITQAWDFKVAPSARPALPAPIPASAKVLQLINRFRRQGGLKPCHLDESLCAAAMDYSGEILKASLHQTTRNPDRKRHVLRYAYPAEDGSCLEVVSIGRLGVENVMQAFFDSPYHRMPLLQEGTLDIGVGIHDDVMGVLFSLSEQESVGKYPADQQKDVPTTWDPLDELENPLKVHGVDFTSARFGYPITLFLYSPYTASFSGVRASVNDSSGNPVPCYLNTPENDAANLQSGVILVPKTKKKSATTGNLPRGVTPRQKRRHNGRP